MRDVTPWLVPVTDEPIGLDQHLRFLRHMAALHAAFWACGGECEVVPVMHRYLELSPWLADAEAAVGSAHLVPRLVGQGWPRLAEVAPAAAAIVTPLARDPGPLVAALEATPQTFVHSNWKLDNLGTDDAGPHRAARLGTAGARRGAVRPGLVPGHQLPPAAAVEGGGDRRLPPGAGGAAGSTPSPGGSASWRCACWARWSSSAGRRRWAATTRSWHGGRRRRSRRPRCWAERWGAGRPTRRPPRLWAEGPEPVYASLARAAAGLRGRRSPAWRAAGA